MKPITTPHLIFAVLIANTIITAGCAAAPPDISTLPTDLTTPKMTDAKPAAGRRVRMTLDEYKDTQVHHSLYLPTDWQPGKTYPVIVEYAGNGPYRNNHGDTCTGRVEDCNLGYGISGGEGFIWVCLPYVSKTRDQNQLQWWGDVEATVAYAKAAVPQICKDFGGDSTAVFIAGFSRGAIACNYIGLHDDEIARLWRGFICHSHYDGVRQWRYADSDRAAAAKRLQRLKDRPQFISHEGSIDQTQLHLQEAYPKGNFTFRAIPFRNHTDTWTLRDLPERKAARAWLKKVLADTQKKPEEK